MQHGSCKYFGFKGLRYWCRHPAHPGVVRQLDGSRFVPRCVDYLDFETKALPGRQNWATPLSSQEER